MSRAKTAKERVLAVHKHAYCCRVFGMLQGQGMLQGMFGMLQGQRIARTIAYFGIFKVAKSTKPIGIGLTQAAAWRAAAANLKGATK